MKRLIISGRWDNVKRNIQNSYPDVKDTELHCDEENQEEALYQLMKTAGKEHENRHGEHELLSFLSI